MGRRAKILAVIADAYGDDWDIREFRHTDFGWTVAIGWPSGQPRGSGGVGGPRVVLTAELVEHLEAVRQAKKPIAAAGLPLGRPQMKRLRSLLGHNRKTDRHAWWAERSDDLRSLPFTEFAAKHGCKATAAESMHVTLFGERRGRDAAWWASPETQALLTGGLPIVAIADQLGRSCREIWDARYRMRLSESKVKT